MPLEQRIERVTVERLEYELPRWTGDGWEVTVMTPSFWEEGQHPPTGNLFVGKGVKVLEYLVVLKRTT
jgi:hypothetical protein